MKGLVEALLCFHFHISSVHSPTTTNVEALWSCAKYECGPTLFRPLFCGVTVFLSRSPAQAYPDTQLQRLRIKVSWQADTAKKKKKKKKEKKKFSNLYRNERNGDNF